MKKFKISVLCLAMVLALAACSDNTKDAVKDAAQDAKEGIENVADNVKTDVEDTLDNAGDAAKDALDKVDEKLDDAKDDVKEALDKVDEKLDGAADEVKDAIDTVDDKVDGAVDEVKDTIGGIAGVANPVVALDSLEALNKKMGCSMVKPGVMGVTDEAFNVISDTMAEYKFTVGGYNYCLRCQGTMDDICGIYGDNGTLFEGKTAEDVYAEGAGYKAIRWFNVEGQYVLTVNDNGELSKETFEGIAEELKEASQEEIIQDSDGVFAEINGDFQDSVSGRANATVESADDSAKITVRWGDSAFETYVWNMTVTFDDGKFVYTDCVESKETAAEDGTVSTETISENGSGYFTYTEGNLVWDGAADENCKSCVFERNFEQ